MLPLFLVGYDGTSSGRAAVRLAMSLAAESSARVVAVYVADGLQPDEARRLLDGLRGELEGAIDTRVTSAPSVAAGLHALALHDDAALIVVGPHRGPSGRRTGSTARTLLNGAPCPVAVAPQLDPAYERPITRLAVAYDGSQEAELALGTAAWIAGATGAGLRLLAVEDPAAGGDGTHRTPAEAVHEAAARLDRDGLGVVADVLHGSAGEQLVAASRAGVDLLVVGSRPEGPPGTVVAGSVAGHVADHAPCPILVVPRSAGDREAAR
jgi:nucleotide-binding universal stress UspA family protein